MLPDPVARSDVRVTSIQEVAGSILFVEIGHDIISTAFPPYHWFKYGSCWRKNVH